MDFNTAVMPLVLFSKFFGLAPYTLIRKTNGTSTYQVSNLSRVYSVVWFIAIGIGNILGSEETFTSQKGSLFLRSCARIMITCYYALYISAYAISFLYCNSIRDMFELLSKLVIVLEVPNTLLQKYRRVILGQIIVCLCLSSTNSIGDILMNEQVPAFKMWFIVLVLNELSILIPWMQFCNVVLLLAQLLGALNAKLSEHETDRSHVYGLSVRPVKRVRVCWQLKERQTTSSKNPMPMVLHREQGERPKSTRSSREEAEHVEETKDWVERYHASNIHSALIEMAKNIDSIYGFLNLLSLVIFYIELISCVYEFILVLSSKAIAQTKYLVVSLVILSLLDKISKLVLMVYCCQSFKLRAKDLAYTVSKLQTNAVSTRVRNQMQTFSLQLLQRNFEFSAFGLFPIDATLIHGIAASATTYIMVLNQFAGESQGNHTTTNSSQTPA